jgi:hypothetical protein
LIHELAGRVSHFHLLKVITWVRLDLNNLIRQRLFCSNLYRTYRNDKKY